MKWPLYSLCFVYLNITSILYRLKSVLSCGENVNLDNYFILFWDLWSFQSRIYLCRIVLSIIHARLLFLSNLVYACVRSLGFAVRLFSFFNSRIFLIDCSFFSDLTTRYAYVRFLVFDENVLKLVNVWGIALY